MECGTPREGSLCLPTSPNWWRLVLIALALSVGASAGVGFYATFEEPAEAVVVGLTSTEIALHVVGVIADTLLVIRACDGPVAGVHSTTQVRHLRSWARRKIRIFWCGFRGFFNRFFGGGTPMSPMPGWI